MRYLSVLPGYSRITATFWAASQPVSGREPLPLLYSLSSRQVASVRYRGPGTLDFLDQNREVLIRTPSFAFTFTIYLKSSFADPDPHKSALILATWIWIRIHEGKNDHQKRKKIINFMFWSAGCPLFRAEDFFCCLDDRFGGLEISKLQVLIKKIILNISAVNFFLQFLAI